MSKMNWAALFCLLLMTLPSYNARSAFNKKRRRGSSEERNYASNGEILDIPKNSKDLLEAEPIQPGHTLLQPSLGMLKSASKFPQKEQGRLLVVYGNLDNLSITYGKTRQRILHTGFRRANDVLEAILKEASKTKRKPILVFILSDPDKLLKMESEYAEKVYEWENNASEILEDAELSDEANGVSSFKQKDFRRKKYSSSESSDYERNPGNPYTVYKNKYLQNWLWNHNMDGDHMNVNPYAPEFKSLGPTGAALFFNRKWWYYNQDDYRPFD